MFPTVILPEIKLSEGFARTPGMQFKIIIIKIQTLNSVKVKFVLYLSCWGPPHNIFDWKESVKRAALNYI